MNEQEQGFDFTPQQVDRIREAHIDIIWESHKDMVEDPEAFDEYMNKMSMAHTLATMLLIEQDRAEKA